MAAVKLSILIPSITSRATLLKRLISTLENQRKKNKLEDSVEILTLVDDGKSTVDYMSIGEKCNKLLSQAKGEYVVFIGDDDKVASTYVKDLTKVTRDPYGKDKKKYSCITFNCKITTDGENPKKQIYHVDNKHYKNTQEAELRPPGMITPILRSIAIKIPFETREREKDRGVGQKWSMDLVNSQLLKTSIHIDKYLYFYRYSNKK